MCSGGRESGRFFLTPSGRRATLAGEHTFVPTIDPEVSSMLTGRQQEIWKYLTDYGDAHGYPPTVREIGEAVGLASPSTVHAHLANLERAGLIKRDPTKPRALELRRDPKPAAAQAGDAHRLPAPRPEAGSGRGRGRPPAAVARRDRRRRAADHRSERRGLPRRARAAGPGR